MSWIERLHQKKEELQEHFELLSKKVLRLRKAYGIETVPELKDKIERQLKQAEIERDEVEGQLSLIEKQSLGNSLKIGIFENSSQAIFPFNLQKEIIEFLTSLPNIHDGNAQRALIYNAGLDEQLIAQIHFVSSTIQFFQLLVPTLSKYGQLNDGRNALEAVLESAKIYVGYEQRENCDRIISEIYKIRSEKKS